MLATLLLLGACAARAASTAPLPQIVHKDGRHALMVDGAPFFMLGAQVNNSSAWPAQMPMVWPAIDKLGANTLEVPIGWEQIEVAPGSGRHALLARVEEGRFVDGRWVFHHIWNGDQTDYGLNFTTVPRILKVTLGSY